MIETTFFLKEILNEKTLKRKVFGVCSIRAYSLRIYSTMSSHVNRSINKYINYNKKRMGMINIFLMNLF
jgi:hypothetical protein